MGLKTKLIKATLSSAIFLSSPAFASVDFDTAETDEQKYAVCELLYKFAYNIAVARDNGKTLQEAIEITEEGFSDYGYKTRHVMTSTVKGAFLHSDQSPEEYASETQISCQHSWGL